MRYVVWIAALALTSLVGCQTVETTERGLVGIDRKQTIGRRRRISEGAAGNEQEGAA